MCLRPARSTPALHRFCLRRASGYAALPDLRLFYDNDLRSGSVRAGWDGCRVLFAVLGRMPWAIAKLADRLRCWVSRWNPDCGRARVRQRYRSRIAAVKGHPQASKLSVCTIGRRLRERTANRMQTSNAQAGLRTVARSARACRAGDHRREQGPRSRITRHALFGARAGSWRGGRGHPRAAARRARGHAGLPALS